MYVAAITRWGNALEAEIAPLAAALDEQPYDLRMKVAGPLPVYVFRGADQVRAQQVLAILQRRGHGAVGVALDHVRASEQMLSPRHVRFEQDRLSLEQAMTQDELVYDDLLAIVHALQTQEVDATHLQSQSKLSVGRAMLTGGLAWTKSKTVETNQQQQDAEQVLYLFRRSGEAPVLLRQLAIRPEGLSVPTPRTSLEALRATIDELRKRAPSALYDNRLLTNKRKASLVSHVVNAKSSTTSHSNTSETDLAAHVIALAHLKAQL